MSLSHLPVPSGVSELQDLEQDLEQALDGGDYFPVEETTEETGQIQSVADSEGHQEEPSPRLTLVTLLLHLMHRLIAQSRSLHRDSL